MTEVAQNGLTKQERQALLDVETWGESQDEGTYHRNLHAAVESIVAARVAALRAEIATQIEADRDASGLGSLPSHIRIPVHIAYDECARIARGGSGD